MEPSRSVHITCKAGIQAGKAGTHTICHTDRHADKHVGTQVGMGNRQGLNRMKMPPWHAMKWRSGKCRRLRREGVVLQNRFTEQRADS